MNSPRPPTNTHTGKIRCAIYVPKYLRRPSGIAAQTEGNHDNHYPNHSMMFFSQLDFLVFRLAYALGLVAGDSVNHTLPIMDWLTS